MRWLLFSLCIINYVLLPYNQSRDMVFRKSHNDEWQGTNSGLIDCVRERG